MDLARRQITAGVRRLQAETWEIAPRADRRTRELCDLTIPKPISLHHALYMIRVTLED